MRRVISRLAIGAVLALGVAPLTASAQAPQRTPTLPDLKLSKNERAAFEAVQTAIAAKDYTTATTALNAAQAAVEGVDGRYAFANLQFTVGRASSNGPLAAAGLEGMIASGKVPQADLPALYKNLAAFATNAKDYEKADRALSRYIELMPNDTEGMLVLAQTRISQKRIPDALALIDRAIALRKGAGQSIPEQWYKVAVGQAYATKLAPQGIKVGRVWLSAYPDPKNWRDALAIFRELTAPDKETGLDIYRLLRAAKALAGERDYGEYAQILSNSGYPGEAKAVIDEGVAARVVDLAKAPFGQLRTSLTTRSAAIRPTLPSEEKQAIAAATGSSALIVANSYFGYGDYAKAITLYRAALQKGSVDANLVNTRLGLALALNGQKAEAEAAIKSITGARSDLASYILVWLSQRA